LQVEHALRTSLDENVRMVADTIAFLKSQGLTVFYDAEHFFDGYKHNSAYALEVARAAADAARTHLPEGFELLVSVEPQLPPVSADPDKLRQILVNLTENAIKYSPGGGRIELSVVSRDSIVAFSVRDEGIGISPEEQAHIFERFHRADPNMSRGVGGTGLGLYICRELVNGMDGQMWVTSREGEGSTFRFELPVARTT
jgi:signal transduction histidine kinase